MSLNRYVACIANGTRPDDIVLSAKTIGDLFHKCQQEFGCCIGRLVSYDAENPIWRFARCDGKFESCKTTIVDVKVYWEEK